MSTNPDFDALMKHVEKAEPDDHTPLLVLADWCDEHEDLGADWSYALRWCAGRTLRPFFRADLKRYPWEWLRDQQRYDRMSGPQVKARAHARIPATVFDAIPSEDGACYIISSKTCFNAYQGLVDALYNVRDDVSYPDLPPKIIKPAEVKLAICRACGVARVGGDACPVCQSAEVLA